MWTLGLHSFCNIWHAGTMLYMYVKLQAQKSHQSPPLVKQWANSQFSLEPLLAQGSEVTVGEHFNGEVTPPPNGSTTIQTMKTWGGKLLCSNYQHYKLCDSESTLAVTEFQCSALKFISVASAKGVTFPLLCRMRSEVLASGHKQASPWCTWDELKQFSRHDVKCSVESRAWSFLLSAAASSFKASPEPLGQGIVWPVCFKSCLRHLNRKWFITGLQHSNILCLHHYNIPPTSLASLRVCLGWPLEYIWQPDLLQTLWIWISQRQISIFKNDNIYWTNTISSHFLRIKNTLHSWFCFHFWWNHQQGGMLIQQQCSFWFLLTIINLFDEVQLNH